MANEANSEEAVTPQQSAELGESWAGEGALTPSGLRIPTFVANLLFDLR